MNFSLPGLILAATGALFIYAAVKDQTPAQVIKDAITTGIKSPATPSQGGIDPTISPATKPTPPVRIPIENRSGV